MAYFPEITSPIQFEGKGSRNPLAFKYYEANRKIGSKTMAEHLRFAVCYWHTFRGVGSDPFGIGTMDRSWAAAPDPLQRAKDTMDAAFEFFTKLGVDLWCFHDTDISPEGNDLTEYAKNLDEIVAYAEEKQREHNVKLLWGTANLFSNPRYQAGASTNPDPHVFATAATQVKHALEATHRLGGAGYVFWGGREGYDTLWNTKMQQEREQFAALLHMAVAHKKKIGFDGPFYIEPKPKEPTKHQYDSDVAACLNFLREFDLMEHLKLNIETNHATLAGHSMQHELRSAREAGALGSIDANTGDELIGWDTDQFPTNLYLTTQIMLEVLAMGGFTTGGLNFDAKVRRQSHESVDLFYAHIGGMDAFARGLEIAHTIVEDGRLDRFVEERYSGWNGDLGQKILARTATLDECEAFALANGEPTRKSGRQEFLENLINEFM
ncbi:MAG: xylose isomerase [Fimbriimonadaceae bacterium]|jgi:xylose isomerase|nr:xylose isomerase [Fimbriimonadaceae bacterium]